MTPRQWTVTGWVLLGAAALLAVVSAVVAFVAVRPGASLPTNATTVFVLAIVVGVLAGVAFFSGLACFFWSAAQQRRDQLAEILDRLEARTGGARP